MFKLKTAVRIIELGALVDTIIWDYDADEKVQIDAFIKSVLEQLKKINVGYTESIMKDKILSTLDKANTERDDAIRALQAVINGYALFPIESKRVLALPLKAIIDKYIKGGIINANYMSKSKMIESMMVDFAAESLAKSKEDLEGVSEAIASVRSAQDSFMAKKDDFITANTNKTASASSYKKPIMTLINNKLVPYLDAMVIAENENCLSFASKIAEEISRMNETIDRRKGAQPLSKEPQAGSNEPQQPQAGSQQPQADSNSEVGSKTEQTGAQE